MPRGQRCRLGSAGERPEGTSAVRRLRSRRLGAELASGEGRERIYLVEPTGEFEDDPNVTDKKFPGNPTLSLRSRAPLRVAGELTDWVGRSAAKLQAMRDGIEALKRRGAAHIMD
jgi:rifampin ADP-ribosylating transferase